MTPTKPPKKNYFTPNGWQVRKNELYQLTHHERPKIVELVNWAASNGDRSENGDYIYGKRKLRELDYRIRYLTKCLENVELVDPELRDKTTQIFFGATVSLIREDDLEQTIAIVGIDETDIAKGKISWISPLAKVLIGHFEGEEVILRTPEKNELIFIDKVVYQRID